jgi:hypothetical protein
MSDSVYTHLRSGVAGGQSVFDPPTREALRIRSACTAPVDVPEIMPQQEDCCNAVLLF